MKFPNGLDEIVAVYGDPEPYKIGSGLRVGPEWEAKILTRIEMPEVLPLSWDGNRYAVKVSCHKGVAPSLTAILNDIYEEGLWPRMRSYGGCYAWRLKRGGRKFSTHCWGIAVDIAVATNQMGTPGDMDPGIIGIFKDHGWTWGGDWSYSDPMHFQACSGY